MITWYAMRGQPAAGVLGPPPQVPLVQNQGQPISQPTSTARCAVSSPPPEFPASARGSGRGPGSPQRQPVKPPLP